MSMLRRAACFAVALCLTLAPALAQEPPAEGATNPAVQETAAPSTPSPAPQEDTGSYLPPSARNSQKRPSATSAAISPTASHAHAAPGVLGAPGPSATQKTIAVISTIGETFTVKSIGLTVLANEQKSFPISSWKVDDRVTAAVGILLKKNFKVKRIPVTAGAFASLDAPGRLLRNNDEDHLEIVRRLAGGQKADYYLVIGPGGSPFGSSSQSMSGLGVARASGSVFGVGGGDYVHALTLIRVYDGEFKLVRNAAGSIGQEGFMATVKGPHQVLEEESQRLPAEPQAAANDPRAKQIALDLLDKSLAMTLPRLFAQD